MKLNKRTIVLLVSLAALLAAVVGSTAAYVFDRAADDITSTFAPVRVTCEVVEGISQTYTVRNTGDTDAYIRVAVVVNWKKDNKLYAKAPEFTVSLGEHWVLGSDGYYYFTECVAVGDKTDGKLTVTVLTEKPDGHELFIEVIASAVQATTVAVQNWSNGVASAATDGGPLTVKAS